MRKPTEQSQESIPVELHYLYKRIECNARIFGMSPAEVRLIKKECKIAFQHKQVLERVERKQKDTLK